MRYFTIDVYDDEEVWALRMERCLKDVAGSNEMTVRGWHNPDDYGDVHLTELVHPNEITKEEVFLKLL